MALEVKIKLNPAGRLKYIQVFGPQEWQGVDWDEIALAVEPNYALKFRIQKLFADLHNDWKALQRRKEAENKSLDEKAIRSRLAQKAEWPVWDGLPSEILADERTRDGIHLVYGKPRSGTQGGGTSGNGFICPCMTGAPCPRSKEE